MSATQQAKKKTAARYKCLANVVQKRARKGFNVRYIPDVHWRAALYAALERGLSELQNDGFELLSHV